MRRNRSEPLGTRAFELVLPDGQRVEATLSVSTLGSGGSLVSMGVESRGCQGFAASPDRKHARPPAYLPSLAHPSRLSVLGNLVVCTFVAFAVPWAASPSDPRDSQRPCMPPPTWISRRCHPHAGRPRYRLGLAPAAPVATACAAASSTRHWPASAGQTPSAAAPATTSPWATEASDTVSGGPGSDWLTGGAGGDRLFGGAAADLLSGGFRVDVLRGGDSDVLYGDEAIDDLSGDAGDDILHGGTTRDSVDGGGGNDEVYGDSGYDALLGGEGDDALHANEGGKDRLADCGPGEDVVVLDLLDRAGGISDAKMLRGR
jgi:hypothetical protein